MILLIIFFGMALSFCWTEYINPVLVGRWNKKYEQITHVKRSVFQHKPFYCFTCMSGWFSLLIGFSSGYGLGLCVLLLAGGVFAGAIYSKIEMRYL